MRVLLFASSLVAVGLSFAMPLALDLEGTVSSSRRSRESESRVGAEEECVPRFRCFLRSLLFSDEELRVRKKKAKKTQFPFRSFVFFPRKTNQMLSSTLRREASKLARGLRTSALARGGAHVSKEGGRVGLARERRRRRRAMPLCLFSVRRAAAPLRFLSFLSRGTKGGTSPLYWRGRIHPRESCGGSGEAASLFSSMVDGCCV